MLCFFFQAEDGIRDVERSRGLGDVYKRQIKNIILGVLEQNIQNSLSRLGDTKEIKIIVNLARSASLYCCIVIVQSNLMVHYASTMMT